MLENKQMFILVGVVSLVILVGIVISRNYSTETPKKKVRFEQNQENPNRNPQMGNNPQMRPPNPQMRGSPNPQMGNSPQMRGSPDSQMRGPPDSQMRGSTDSQMRGPPDSQMENFNENTPVDDIQPHEYSGITSDQSNRAGEREMQKIINARVERENMENVMSKQYSSSYQDDSRYSKM